MTVRTRFAPSPTGMLHIGGARTALFSWLYARHCQGQFLLRIEDTDRERSTDAATQVILDGLRWLGLDWDDEVVFQSRRQERHVTAVHRLLDEGKAYRCYCSREELDALRESQRAAGVKPRYDGRCRHRTDQPEDVPHVIRFKSPDIGETVVRDLVLGEVTFANQELDDLILMRSDGTPTYNLAVVVDDADMGITHVIRGSDHLNNTPRQMQLYEALGLPVPQFGHIPLIHGPDGAKMSKRHGAVAITEYREAGREALVRLFDVADVGTAAARFDQQKLDWLNGHYLRAAEPEALEAEVSARLGAEGIETGGGPALATVIAALQERSKNLNELAAAARMFYLAPETYDEKAVAKHVGDKAFALLEAFIDEAEQLDAWHAESIHPILHRVCEQAEAKLGALAQPIRVLIAGVPVSPPIDVTLAILGKAESLARLRAGMTRLRAS